MSEIFTHRVEVFTAGLTITGAYDLAIYRRVSDAFNNEQRRFIPLRDATIAPFMLPEQPQRAASLLLDRNEVVLVATIAEATPPASYAREEQHRDMVPVIGTFFTDTSVVRATFYHRPNQTPLDTFELPGDEFLPLSGAQIMPLLGGYAPLVRSFAAIALSRIVAFYPNES